MVNEHRGTRWNVLIEWSGHTALEPLSRTKMDDRRQDYTDAITRDPESWVDLGTDLNPISILFSLALGLVMVMLLPVFGPVFAVIGTVIVALAEVAVLLVLAAVTFGAKVLFGRPWRVLAVNEYGETWVWNQSGWRNARALAERIRRELDAGALPDQIPPGSAEPIGQGRRYNPNDTDLTRKFGVRVAAKVVAIALTVYVLFAALAAVFG